MPETIVITELEIACLDLAYTHTRIRRTRQIVGLADSLLRCGQLVPIVVTVAEPSGFVLIDGYQRVEAARRAGLDTLVAQVWPEGAEQALCRLLTTDGARHFDIFEQACVLYELKNTHGLSCSRIAAQMGRHPSWVTRRLSLFEQLPESAVEAVRAGVLSSWSASRVIVPLARANAGHARALVACLAKQVPTSRQLDSFWQHYRKANRAARENMVADPILFFKSLAARKADDQGQRVADGPEAAWLRDVATVEKILCRLDKTARQVFCPPQTNLQEQCLTAAFNDAQNTFQRLQRTIGRLCNAKDNRPTNRDRHVSVRPEHPADQPADENVQKNHPARAGRTGSGGLKPAQPL